MSSSPAPTSPSASADVPPYRYTAALALQIELGWQDRWEAQGTFEAPNPTGPLSAGFDAVAARPHTYVLDMFPYPSGAGLHVGHPLGFIGTDVLARYLRMRGENVLHTMGFDAFGLPAEQYAVQTGTHPAITTNANIATYRRQLRRMGLGHDPRRSVSTTDVEYYLWTQWIFLQVFNSWYDTDLGKARPIAELIEDLDAGVRSPAPGTASAPWASLDSIARRAVVDAHRLAYREFAPVNWCPGLGTVLANEEVTADGRSDRGNFPVFRKPLAQWTMRITAYADRLLDDLDQIDWPDKVRAMQRNWIGRSVGARVRFAAGAAEVEVFTTRPDTLFGATYVVLAPEHPLVDTLVAGAWPPGTAKSWTGGASTPAEAIASYRAATSAKTDIDRQSEGKEKTGVFIGAYATNPVNGAALPIFIADYVLMGYGTGAIMAVPAEDPRDFEFAEKFDLPVIRTVSPPEGFEGGAYSGDGARINSGFLDGIADKAQAIATVTAWLVERGAGEATTTYRLRDWLFSRQRYWGEPFPIVYDENDMPIALPDSMLPLELPETDKFAPRSFPPDDADSVPEPPLGRLGDWVNVTLDLGDGPKPYRRETSTMPQWAGSCWYEMRYLDPTNSERFVDPEVEKYWMGPTADRPLGGVGLYIGGVEHAVLHLLYARFWHKVLFDLGHVSSAEPFHRLVNQGYVQAFAYTDERGMYVEAADVVEREGSWYISSDDGELHAVNREYGKMGKSLKNVVTPDEMYDAYGADTLRLFEMFTGPLEQSRPWDAKAVVGSFRLLQRIWRTAVDEQTGELHISDDSPSLDLERLLHRTIAAVRDGMETLRFNTSIARLTELNNALTLAYPDGGAPRAIVEPLALMLAPLAPHLAEELWSKLGHADSLAWADFPEADPALLVEDEIDIPVQVGGKVRTVLTVPAGIGPEELEALATSDPKVVEAIGTKTVRRVIVVPGRLVNVVV
ncbi:MAG: leucyl-tRNA synthetase [Pseudonocardiales bacterium]|nr:leucyl-tRNA synthetase [Pseudonocardiales bacterium]